MIGIFFGFRIGRSDIAMDQEAGLGGIVSSKNRRADERKKLRILTMVPPPLSAMESANARLMANVPQKLVAKFLSRTDPSWPKDLSSQELRRY
jgi:hypothetical protein